MPQPDVFIFIRFFHFRPIPATYVNSVDYRRKSIQSPWPRICRKRQRLPPSLLIENASGISFRLPANCLPEAFPIKASDHPPSGVYSGATKMTLLDEQNS